MSHGTASKTAGSPTDSAIAAAVAGTIEVPPIEQMPTGIDGLDHLLRGGLVRGNSLLVEGPPGSGKSTLAVRMIHEGILRYDEPGLIISFEEFPRQLYQESLQFGVDLRALEASGKLRVIWTPPARILEGFHGKNDLVEQVCNHLGVKRLLIDSITHFRRVVTSEQQLREVLATVLSNLKLKGITPFMVKEQDTVDTQRLAFEEYLVDASIRLHDRPSPGGGENQRMIEVRKTRGQDHVSGLHPFELSDRGISIYPRLRPIDVDRIFEGKCSNKQVQRVPFGVEGLDRMLSGGVWSGSLNLVAGCPGTGKSVVAYHFLDAGLRKGESGLLLSIRCTSEQILAQAKSLGMDWAPMLASGQLRILHHHPTGLCVEKLQNDLLREMADYSPDRLVFDSVDDLWDAVKDADRLRDHVLVFGRLLQVAGTTSIMMNEIRAASDARAQDYGYLAACVIQLTMSERDGRLRRFCSVKKFAGSDHAKELREYGIDSRGFRLLEG